MSVIVLQLQTVRFIQMMSLTFGLFTQVSGSGPLGPLVIVVYQLQIKVVFFFFLPIGIDDRLMIEYINSH